MTCHTQQAIADAVEISRQSVDEQIAKFAGNNDSGDSGVFRDFEPKIYQVWNFAKSTNLVKHPGNVPPEILDNLLWYYTKPFDVVFDPFARGGGRCRWWGGV